MPNALITGSGPRVSAVAAALRCEGFEPVLVGDASDAALAAPVLPGALDCYVQLPDHAAGERRGAADCLPRMTALAEASARLTTGGAGRYAAAATVAPMLTATATVVLVMDDRVARGARSGVAAAVDDLTRALARTLRQDYRSTAVTVALVEERRTPSEIASIARHGRLAGPDHPASVGTYVDFEPDLGFADWRLEVLSRLDEGP